MSHVILLGDSIFDNARYVPDRPPVIEQVRRSLPGWHATLLAVDGHVTSDVAGQLTDLPTDATHFVISVGGNDALGESPLLGEAACTVADAIAMFGEVQSRFRQTYAGMLRSVLTLQKPTGVCTIYDAIPGLEDVAKTALALFNDVILREAFVTGSPVIDLRLVCDSPDDYSPLSPIEPSHIGGAKIARAVAEMVTRHNFASCRTAIFR